MALQNGIKNNWGGRPYLDLVKGFEYIEANIPYIGMHPFPMLKLHDFKEGERL